MIDKFDLPENCAHDHVLIEMAESSEYPLIATPFDNDGTGGFTEPETWDVTDRYREAVRNGTEIPLELIDLEQPPTEEGGNF